MVGNSSACREINLPRFCLKELRDLGFGKSGAMEESIQGEVRTTKSHLGFFSQKIHIFFEVDKLCSKLGSEVAGREEGADLALATNISVVNALWYKITLFLILKKETFQQFMCQIEGCY